MQPRRPHGQRAPPISTTTWPISPEAPLPYQGLESRMIPPPTPVPQKTPSSELNSRAAPSSNSASVATLTSLPIAIGAPSACCSAPASGKLPSQPGRLRALETTPAASSITPGEPTPTATGSPWPAAASRIAAAIASATSCGPPVVGVGTRASPSTWKSSSTTTAWTLVPPRSIPPRRLMSAP